MLGSSFSVMKATLLRNTPTTQNPICVPTSTPTSCFTWDTREKYLHTEKNIYGDGHNNFHLE